MDKQMTDLDKKRDSLAEAYFKKITKLDVSEHQTLLHVDFKAGFDAAVKELRGEIVPRLTSIEATFDEAVTALNAYREQCEKLAAVLADCMPSWLPEGIRDQRRNALRDYAKFKKGMA